jgi:hypothetical protein
VFLTDNTVRRTPSTEAIRLRVRERLAEQRVLVASLLRLRAQLKGSLIMRYGQCGKPGCACRTGRGHGPYYVLSTRSGGRGGFAYLAGERAREARALVARNREFRRRFRRLKRVNEDLIGLLRRYQDQGSREGGRRLGLVGRQKGTF